MRIYAHAVRRSKRSISSRRSPVGTGARVALLATVVAATAACAPGESPPEVRDPRIVDQLTTTADGSVRLRADTITLTPDTPPPVTGGGDAGAGPVIRVDPDVRRQPFDGLGAALTDSSAWLLSRLPDSTRAAALSALFATDPGTATDPDTGTDPDNRAGLSVVRLVIGSSDFARSHYTYDDSPTPDPDLAGFSIDHDRAYVIPTAREILTVNPNVQFVASP